MWQDLLCMARVISRCMLCYGTRNHHRRQGSEISYLLLSSLPTHTCILESLSQELKIILQMVRACVCMCVHICVCLCVCVPTNPQALTAFPSFSFKNYLLATAQGTLLNVKWQPGWEGSLGENGYVYIYGWVPLLSTQNYHNTVNWLYSNIK